MSHGHSTTIRGRSGIAANPVDHEVTKSLHFEDHDGNGVAVYVDLSDVWRQDPQRVAQLIALELQEFKPTLVSTDTSNARADNAIGRPLSAISLYGGSWPI